MIRRLLQSFIDAELIEENINLRLDIENLREDCEHWERQADLWKAKCSKHNKLYTDTKKQLAIKNKVIEDYKKRTQTTLNDAISQTNYPMDGMYDEQGKYIGEQ
jgi:regulator of replication initiation timing